MAGGEVSIAYGGRFIPATEIGRSLVVVGMSCTSPMQTVLYRIPLVSLARPLSTHVSDGTSAVTIMSRPR